MSTLINQSTKSQSAQILADLQSGKTITPIDALNHYGCFRLGARIYDLKKAGHDIETVNIQQAGKRFASYRLKQ